MSNHFHLLCEVPEAKTLSEGEVLERIEAGYGPARREALQQELAHSRAGSPRRCGYRSKGIGTKGRKGHEETTVVEGK